MPRRTRRAIALAASVAAVWALSSATALSFYEPVTRSADLDGDSVQETARTVPRDMGGEQWTTVHVRDDCMGGPVDRRIAGVQESLGFLRTRPADTVPGREVFVDLRSGASGRAGEARVVAWRAGDTDCGQPRRLFAYSTGRSSRPPRGALPGASNFQVQVRDITARFRGREVILDEYFLSRDRPASCCPRFRKRSLFRYDPLDDRYERYRSRVFMVGSA
jgi:hypothetical protein